MSLLLDLAVAALVLLVAAAVVVPGRSRAKLEQRRSDRLEAFERERDARVISMIHR